jgi:hypothetical protein
MLPPLNGYLPAVREAFMMIFSRANEFIELPDTLAVVLWRQITGALILSEMPR